MLYKVRSRVDRSGVAYIPEGAKAPTALEIEVDSTGFIDLEEKDAAPLLKARAISPLNEEIARLERIRDEALATAKKAQADLDAKQAGLQKIIDARKKTGAPGVEELAVKQSKEVAPKSGGK